MDRKHIVRVQDAGSYAGHFRGSSLFLPPSEPFGLRAASADPREFPVSCTRFPRMPRIERSGEQLCRLLLQQLPMPVRFASSKRMLTQDEGILVKSNSGCQ